MKTGYSFGSLASFVEQINNTTVKLTGDQTIAGSKTFSSNPISSAAQGSGGAYLTRRDFVENLLSYKAPTDSPAFTGNPTAPTAALFDADTTIATTAFVQRALGNHQSYVWTGDATIQPGWAGCFIWYAGAGTLYLPNFASVPVGATFEIMCTGTGAITAQSGEIIILPNGVQINSFTPLAGDTGKFVRLDTGWAYSGSNYCATAATGDRSTRPASTQFVRNYLESSPQLAGNVHVEGGVNVTQEFQTTSATGYRIAYGDYGAFWYFDNWNMYLMFTNNGDKWGGYNGLRPFSADCRTGHVSMSNGVSVGGGLTADSFIVTGDATIDGHLHIKQFSFIDGKWWRDTQPYTIDGNYACSAVYDVYFDQLPSTIDTFLPIVGASANTLNEGYQVRVKFGVYSTSGVGGWGRKHAGIWVGNGESTAGPKYLYKFNVYGGFYCNAVVADTTLTAGTSVTAQQYVSTIADVPALRMAGGNYGTLFFNDSNENFYILLTNANDQLGGFNNLRPFIINRRTGGVTHQHGLTVNGGIVTNALTTTDIIDAGRDIISAGSIVARASYNNIPASVTSYTKGGMSYGLGVSTDAKPFMILMCPLYSGTLLNKSGMSGRVTLSRGSTGSGLIDRFVDFSIVSGYGNNILEIYHQNANARIVTTTHNSVAYYALYFDATSAVDVIFDGIRYDQDFTPTLIPDATGYNTGVVSSGELYARLDSPSFTGTVACTALNVSNNMAVQASTTLRDLTVNTVLHTRGNATFEADVWAGNGVVTGGAFFSPRADTPAFRMTGGTYGTLFYNDGGEAFFILCTNANDQYGRHNDLRPFYINKRTGLVQMGNGLTVAAGLWTDQAHISSATNSAPTQAIGTNNTTIASTAFVQAAIGNKSPANKNLTEGYQQMPNGMIMKWGYFTSAVDENISVTFSAATGGAFPNACVTVSDGGCLDAITAGTTWTANSLTRTGFVSNRDDGVQGTYTLRYIAWGY